jgi:hypothetical protein
MLPDSTAAQSNAGLVDVCAEFGAAFAPGVIVNSSAAVIHLHIKFSPYDLSK